MGFPPRHRGLERLIASHQSHLENCLDVVKLPICLVFFLYIFLVCSFNPMHLKGRQPQMQISLKELKVAQLACKLHLQASPAFSAANGAVLN